MKKITIALASASALILASGLSFAAGSSSNEPAMPKPKVKTCKVGYMMVKNVCKKIKKSELSDDVLFEQGQALAKAGEYDAALEILAAVQNQEDPKVLNYQGYSHRKSGRLETAVTYYRKALNINPNYILAREYLGEGYVAAGRIDLAKIELNEIAKRCGTTCEEYKMLSKFISAGG
jgi:tetratricopeptide (TPR) repeat protein